MTAREGPEGTVYSVLVQAGGPNGPALVAADSVRVVLSDQDGRLAEVQVAYARGGLVVIAAGSTFLDRDTRGFARIRVTPE